MPRIQLAGKQLPLGVLVASLILPAIGAGLGTFLAQFTITPMMVKGLVLGITSSIGLVTVMVREAISQS